MDTTKKNEGFFPQEAHSPGEIKTHAFLLKLGLLGIYWQVKRINEKINLEEDVNSWSKSHVENTSKIGMAPTGGNNGRLN